VGGRGNEGFKSSGKGEGVYLRQAIGGGGGLKVFLCAGIGGKGPGQKRGILG